MPWREPGLKPGSYYQSETTLPKGFQTIVDSTLVQTVAALDIARGAYGTPSKTVNIPGRNPVELATLEKTLKHPYGAAGFMGDDPEFNDLWRFHRRYTTDVSGRSSITAENLYAGFLTSNSEPTGRLFAATPFFQGYVKDLLIEGNPGPYFEKVLETLRNGDTRDIQILSSGIIYSFRRWDTQLNWLLRNGQGFQPIPAADNLSDLHENALKNMTEPKAEQHLQNHALTYRKFRKSADEVYSILFDKKDTSTFRRFALQFFPTVDHAAIEFIDPANYDPAASIDRIKDLAGSVDEKDWKTLADYLLISEWHHLKNAKPKADSQLKAGGVEAARAIVNFHIGFQNREPGWPGITFYDNEPDAVAFWADQYGSGLIDEEQLASVPEGIKALREAKKLLAGQEDVTFNKVVQNNLEGIGLTKAVLQAPHISRLAKRGYIPTPGLISFLDKHGDSAWEIFAELEKKRISGNFDPSNIAARDLVFKDYLKLVFQNGEASYDDFCQLEKIPEEIAGASLDISHRSEAQAASFEAAQVYWLARTRAEAGKSIAFVGNHRYGDHFIMSPIENELKDLRLPIHFYSRRVSSTVTNNLTVADVFNNRFIGMLKQEMPDVLIADGTPNSNLAGIPRFPGAMLGYLNFFLAYNLAAGHKEIRYPHIDDLLKKDEFNELSEKLFKMGVKNKYRISHWLAQPPSESVYVGDVLTPRVEPELNAPEVIFINPVIPDTKYYPNFPLLPTVHEPGIFDDPDKIEGQAKIWFTDKGVDSIKSGMSEQQYVRLVQEEMERNMREMKRRTDPMNQPL